MPKSFGKLHNEIGFKNIGTKRLVGESAELLKTARTAVRKADPWVQPSSSQASRRWAAEASGWAQHSLSWEAVVSKGNPPQLWGCSNGDKKWLQRGLRWGAQHGRVPGSPSLVVLRCRQERQKLCVCRDRSRPVVLALQSDSAQRLCLAFGEDLP